MVSQRGGKPWMARAWAFVRPFPASRHSRLARRSFDSSRAFRQNTAPAGFWVIPRERLARPREEFANPAGAARREAGDRQVAHHRPIISPLGPNRRFRYLLRDRST